MGSVSSSVFRLPNSLINLVPISFVSNIDLDIAMPWYWNGLTGHTGLYFKTFIDVSAVVST